MDSSEKNADGSQPKQDTTATRGRAKKRKRSASESDSSSDDDTMLPDNCLEVEKNLHASAIKNNLTEKHVKHIIKKVVTNDHVLALVQLREEEEGSGTEDESNRPKLTRAKVKELMKASPQSTQWNIELTPINHIPVKTRPEVKALIAQELPDESDEEYQPNNDDVPSDDDHTLESCSDLESQPRTPATPKGDRCLTPRVVKDGPFKVPQDTVTPTKRRLEMNDKDATIALRTRSKLSLSATPIEHIESEFIPPDDLPLPDADDMDQDWNEFLTNCLNPALAVRNEEDDDTDPEYNVAADAAAHDEDEEALENSLIKISKKELSDLVAELFHIMPDGSIEDSVAEKLINNGCIEATNAGHSNDGSRVNHSLLNVKFEGKLEPLSEDDASGPTNYITAAQVKERRKSVLIGKNEPVSDEESVEFIVLESGELSTGNNNLEKDGQAVDNTQSVPQCPSQDGHITIQVEETSGLVASDLSPQHAPAILHKTITKRQHQAIEIHMPADNDKVVVLPEQILIFQQQLRQHIQLATCNFLHLFVHPVHWRYAPQYKEYIESLHTIYKGNPNSVVNVCNLVPARELILSWEESVAQDTPINKEMIEFVQKECDICNLRMNQNNLYVGKFHPMFQQVVANSTVFLYPYLLPPLPYRSESCRRNSYFHSEDELIALGLDQFWQYVEDNPALYPPPPRPNKSRRWGLAQAMQLVCKYMMPWMQQRLLANHVHNVRKGGSRSNPINRFFLKREIVGVKHKLLSYNPNITLYDHPEHEIPMIWMRYLSTTSKRAKKFMGRNARIVGRQMAQPAGVEVVLGKEVEAPKKTPLPKDFTKKIVKNRLTHKMRNAMIAAKNQPIAPKNQPLLQIMPLTPNNSNAPQDIITIVGSTDTQQTKPVGNVNSVFNVVNTSNGTFLIPITVLKTDTATVNSINSPITTCNANNKNCNANNTRNSDKDDDETATISFSDDGDDEYVREQVLNKTTKTTNEAELAKDNHCACCSLIRGICKERQTVITDFFKPRCKIENTCPCRKKTFPKMTKRFKVFMNNFSSKSYSVWKHLHSKHTGTDVEINFTAENDSIGKQYLMSLCQKDDNELVTEDDQDYEKSDWFQDYAFATNFHLKMWTHLTIAKNPYIKKRVHSLLSNFVMDHGNPVYVASRLESIIREEMPNIFHEFLTMCTEAQADELSKYREYFIELHLHNFLTRVQEEAKDSAVRDEIMVQLHKVLLPVGQSACHMCSQLLPHLKPYPRLAQYYFSLFPHRHKNWKPPETSKGYERSESPVVYNHCSTPNPGNVSNYEADKSSSDEDETTLCKTVIEQNINEGDHIHHEESTQKSVEEPTEKEDNSETESLKLVICKAEDEDCNDYSESSIVIMLEEENSIKSEVADWTREEDKVILEVLKETLLPARRIDKTVEDILIENNVYNLLSDSLLGKSHDDIRNRILYVLDLLVLSEKT